MVELEKAGKPTVMILSHGFQEDAETSAKAFGLAGISYVVVPRVYNNLTHEDVIAQTDPVVESVIRLLVTPVESNGEEVKTDTFQERFEGLDQFEALDRFNEEFLNRDWGDGFPLIPPTEEKVEAMLRGTTLKPDDVVCFLPPAFGVATVEKVAVNCVMAGCKPEHLPVVIAACKAIARMDPFSVRGFLMSTSANAPLILVNGPIRKELNINAERCSLGPGKWSRVNIVIGRALILTLKNVGHWYPGIMDMDTIGTPRKFSMCVAENEEASPWEPFHVEHGFSREASTVTVFPTGGDKDVGDQGNSTAEGLLRTIGWTGVIGGGGYIASLAGEHANPKGGVLILIAPDHAKPISSDGFDKTAAKEYLHHICTLPARRLINSFNVPEKARVAWQWLYKLSPQEQEQIWLPVQQSPDEYHLVCVGGPGPKTLCSPPASPPSWRSPIGQMRVRVRLLVSH